MPAKQADGFLASLLTGMLDLSAQDGAWIHHALTIFAVPTRDHVALLLSEFLRVGGVVPWAAELAPSEMILAPAKRILDAFEQRISAKPLVNSAYRWQLTNGFRGDFILSRTLCRTNHKAPASRPQLEALRWTLVCCAWHWAQVPHKVTAIEHLARAIRGLERSTTITGIPTSIGDASSLRAFIAATSQLTVCEPKYLGEIWQRHFEPELRRWLDRQAGNDSPHPQATARRIVATSPPSQKKTSKPSSQQGWQTDEDDRLVVQCQRARQAGIQPRPASSPEPLIDEHADEVAPPLLTGAVPAQMSNPDARDIQRYQIRQAIWTSNPLQIPEHRSSLSFETYKAVIQGALDTLHDPSISTDLRLGTAALVLVGITGRTPATLTAIDILQHVSSFHDPARLEISPDMGTLQLAPFWQVGAGDVASGFFRPSNDQIDHLEPVRSYFHLVLAPPIAAALRSAQPELAQLPDMVPEAVANLLRMAARHLCQRYGLQFTFGQVRASLPAHLSEQSGDIAMAQLICSDTLGQSTAPLAYYAPRLEALAGTHWHLQNRLLDANDPLPTSPTWDERVGSNLLVTFERAREMARAPARTLRQGVRAMVKAGRVHEVHRAIVNHLTGMLMAVATHRPTAALFSLTINDIWMQDKIGAALFSDKRIDGAHDPRLVALPPMLCRQIRAYFEHLAGLAELSPPLNRHVEEVFAGEAPLLFALTEEGRVAALDLPQWKASMPEPWDVLPHNWGRHWARTRAIELGIRPELVSMQLGHLELVGYPFSGASPTEPWLFVEKIAPDWERIATGQGWIVAQGLTAAQRGRTKPPGPLRSWQSHVKNHEARQRADVQQWEQTLRARLRGYRETALARVLTDQELLDAGIIERYQTRSQNLPAHRLARVDFERIRDRMYNSEADDAALAIALANAVCTLARVVNRRTRQRAENPGSIATMRRPLDGAFVPGMMLALRQTHALRDHCTKPGNRAAHPWEDMASACAHVVLALIVYGRVEDPAQIVGALERRSQRQRSARLQDCLFTPYGDCAHEVLVLRGVAAIVFARLAWRFPDEPCPTLEQIERSLVKLLPDWALDQNPSKAGAIVSLLCETVAISNRYELSPAARMARQSQGGSTAAHMMEQLAYLDGDAVGMLQRHHEDQQGDTPTTPAGATNRPVSTGNARSQYLRLCAVLPSSDKDTALPYMREVIAASNANTPATRSRVVAEIAAWMQEADPTRALQPIVRTLAGWTHDMLAHGTQRRISPAMSTVRTYLTRIGGGLVELFGQSSLDDVEEAVLEEAYTTVIASKPNLRTEAAAAILQFHAHAQEHHGLPEIDLSEVRLYLGTGPDALADARLVLPQERSATLELLNDRATDPDATDPEQVRIARQAAYAMPLMAFGGMRRSEALGLQFRDVTTRSNAVVINLRPNRARRLKTSNARREVALPATSLRVLNTDLGRWTEIERARIGTKRLETAFVFAKLDNPFEIKVQVAIRQACLDALGTITGRDRPRLHHLRHLVAMERITPLFLSKRDRLELAPDQPDEIRPLGPLALPRDLQRLVLPIGHANPATTLRSYHHMPWLLASRTDAHDQDRYANAATLSFLLGQSPQTMFWGVKTRPGRAPTLAWLDIQIQPRTPLGARLPVPSMRALDDSPLHLRAAWSARQLDALLADTGRLGSLDQAILVHGGHATDAVQIREAFAPLEARLGKRLVVENGTTRANGTSRRAVRRLKLDAQLEVLLHWFDENGFGMRDQLVAIAKVACGYANASHQDRLALPPMTATQLHQMLRQLGVDPSQLTIEPAKDSGLDLLRVQRRPITAGSAQRTPGTRYNGHLLKRVLALIHVAGRIHMPGGSLTAVPTGYSVKSTTGPTLSRSSHAPGGEGSQ